MDSHHLTPSQEDYIEAVYRISEEKKAARAKDIADRLNVRAPSVTAPRSLQASRNCCPGSATWWHGSSTWSQRSARIATRSASPSASARSWKHGCCS